MNASKLKKFFKPAIFEADDLHEYFTWWDNVTSAQVKVYLECLDKATSERELQAFFEGHPNLLIQHLGGGHGRWVVPQKRLGSEFVTDFVIGERHSFSFQWQAVEIESPVVPLFTKKGDPSAKLTHAIRQVTDWRAWIKRNQDYASRHREAQGLGLIDIDSSVRGLILLGRERNIDPPPMIAGCSLYKISRSISIRMIGLSEEASTGSKPSNGPALNTKAANSMPSRADD